MRFFSKILKADTVNLHNATFCVRLDVYGVTPTTCSYSVYMVRFVCVQRKVIASVSVITSFICIAIFMYK